MKTYPTPNENGVYFSRQADEILRFTVPTRREFITISVMEVAPAEWVVAHSFRFNECGGGAGLSRKWGIYETKQAGVAKVAARLNKDLIREMSLCDGQKRLACSSLLQQIEQHLNQGQLF